MNNILFLLAFSVILFGQKITDDVDKSPASYVNTFIGTNNAGNTFPGAVLPWGMVSVSPHNCLNFDSEDKTQTGIYVHGQPHIYGFGHVHYSGLGCPIAGNVILMPHSGKLIIDPATNRSAYSHEKSSPGYYEVKLNDSKIFAQMTATRRCGISKYTFENSRAHITLDLSHPINSVNGGFLKVVSDREIEGYETDGGFCGSHLSYKVYFVVRFSKSAENYGIYSEDVISEENSAEGINIGAFYSFDVKNDNEILAKVGISYVSIGQARKNLDAEIPEFQFEKIKKQAEKEWDEQLGKIEVKGGTDKEYTLFYTALYHSLLLPYTYNDADGKYRSFVSNQTRVLPFPERNDTTGSGRSFKILETSKERFTVFSLWDTYRTLHPLLTLAYPEKQQAMVNSLIENYRETGALPLWSMNGVEWGGMVGDPAAIVIADSYLKGLHDYDLETAFKAVKDNSSAPFEGGNDFRRGHDEYARLGFIPEDLKADLGVWGTVSTAMEYSLADFAVAKMAVEMKNNEIAEKLLNRSKAVFKLYDEESCFFRPKLANNLWMEPFDVVSTAGEVVGHDHLGSPGFVEGNAWQYLFFLRHFPEELANVMGGKTALVKRLDECFEKDMFVLWNEPDMHYPFVYSSIASEEWKTQREVTKAINKHFGSGPDGLPGNDDAGTISAWLVFAMMGIYPNAQGLTDYIIFRPAFDKVTLHLENNKKLKIINNPHDEDEFIKEVFFNGNKVHGFKIDHNLISKGGTIELKY